MREVNVRSSRRSWLIVALITITLVMIVGLVTADPGDPQLNTISGLVTDPLGGLPPPETKVFLVSPDGSNHGQANLEPSTGAFDLGPVALGNYVLQAHPPDAGAYTPSMPVFLNITGGPVDAGVLALTEPSIEGVVLAPDGITPTAARVHVYRADREVQSERAPDGEYQIGGLITGTYWLVASPLSDDPYWLSARVGVTITPELSQTVDLTLRPANVTGTVVDPNGIGVAGATMHVVGRNSHTYRQDMSSPSGYFAVGDLAPDTYVVHIEPPWYLDELIASAPISFTVPPSFTNLGHISLRQSPKVVHGNVETNTGEPVAKAHVIANRLDHPGRKHTLTSLDGSYQMRLSSGLWSLTVEPTDDASPDRWIYADPPKLVAFQHNLTTRIKVVNFTVLTADAKVQGAVEMPDGSTPPFTVTVSLRNDEGVGRVQMIDGEDGSFDIGIPNGLYMLTVKTQDPGFVGPAPLPVRVGPNGLVDVGVLNLIERDATISGVVTDENGHGLGGVRISGWMRGESGAQTRSNEDGSFVLAVIGGKWTVRPVVPPDMPYVFQNRPLTYTLSSNQHITGADFELTTAANIVTGQLVDGDGSPVNASGWAMAGDNSGPINGAPIVGGNFNILLPDGDYQVDVRLATGSLWLSGPAQNVSLEGGEVISLTVPLQQQDAFIVGALWDVRRQIVPTGVEGNVLTTNGWTWVADPIDPANGAFKIGVSAGLWRLSYRVDPASGYVVLDHHKVVPIESGQTLAVALPVAKRDSIVRGIVLDPDGDPLPGAAVVLDGIGISVRQVTLRSVSGEDGTFRLPVPHGNYTLRAAYRSEEWLSPLEKSVIARPGQATERIPLQFRVSDVILSGTTSIEGNPSLKGKVHIWAYSGDGAGTKSIAALGEEYSLGLLSNGRWHIGAVLETGESFYVVRTVVNVGSGNQVLDLVLKGPHPKPGPVVVQFDSSQAQSVELSDGTRIFIPAGAMPVEGTVTLRITPIATFPHQHHARLYKYGYVFIATDENGDPIVSKFNQNVLIALRYDEDELAALHLTEQHLKPAYYSTTTQSWSVPESYVVDTDLNRVVTQIDHFTDYTLIGRQLFETFLPAIRQ